MVTYKTLYKYIGVVAGDRDIVTTVRVVEVVNTRYLALVSSLLVRIMSVVIAAIHFSFLAPFSIRLQSDIIQRNTYPELRWYLRPTLELSVVLCI